MSLDREAQNGVARALHQPHRACENVIARPKPKPRALRRREIVEHVVHRLRAVGSHVLGGAGGFERQMIGADRPPPVAVLRLERMRRLVVAAANIHGRRSRARRSEALDRDISGMWSKFGAGKRSACGERRRVAHDVSPLIRRISCPPPRGKNASELRRIPVDRCSNRYRHSSPSFRQGSPRHGNRLPEHIVIPAQVGNRSTGIRGEIGNPAPLRRK